MKRLTKKEEIIMGHFWEKGPLFVRELRSPSRISAPLARRCARSRKKAS